MMGNYSVKAWIENANDNHHTPKNMMRRLDPAFDPRSPSLEIQRTPIYVDNFDESSTSLPQAMDYDDTNISAKSDSGLSTLSVTYSDPSMIISDLNLSQVDSTCSNSISKIDVQQDAEMENLPATTLTPVTVYTDNANKDKEEVMAMTPDQSDSSKPAEKLISLTPVTSNAAEPAFELARKKLFNTTRVGRRPLENVQNTSSPQQLLRSKQWRDFQEERAKLGIKTDENTPPPKFDGCASAPGKLASRRRALVTSNSPSKFHS